MANKDIWTEYNGKGFSAEHAKYAERATRDEDGNDIVDNYATKADVATTYATKESVEAKQDSLTFGYNSNDQIVSIDSHDLAPSADSTVYLANYNSTRRDAVSAALLAGKAVMCKSFHDGDTANPKFGLLGTYNRANNQYQYTFIRKITHTYEQATGDIAFTSVFNASAGDSWFGQFYNLTFKAPTAEGQVMKSVNVNNSHFDWALSTVREVPASTASDADKVLTVNAQGSPVWTTVQGYATDPTIDDSLLLGQSDGSKTWTALERDTFNSLTDDYGDDIQDEEGNSIGDENSVELWTSFNGYEFGARRAYEDQDGNNIKATYVRKDEAFGLDEATEGEVDSIVITYGSVVIGGRTYKTVTIGNQEWLAENLDYKFEGLEIGEEESLVKAIANYYDGDEATYGRYGNRYGLLYNWKAVDYIEQNKATLLPSGWHVPTESEWTTLLTAVGGASVAGAKLKSFSDWSSGNGDDPYGMSIYPCGDYSTVINEYENINVKTWFWTATENSASNNAEYVSFSAGDDAHQDHNPKSVGYSVRLVRTIS